MNFEKDLIKRLQNCLNNMNKNKFSSIYIETNENNIKVKRYDGYGLPTILKTINSNEQLKDYVKKLESLY